MSAAATSFRWDHDVRVRAMMLWFHCKSAEQISEILGCEPGECRALASREGWIRDIAHSLDALRKHRESTETPSGPNRRRLTKPTRDPRRAYVTPAPALPPRPKAQGFVLDELPAQGCIAIVGGSDEEPLFCGLNAGPNPHCRQHQ